MSSDEKPGNYKIGRGKPPQHSKWPKGTSGNRKGRPKGSKNLKTILREALTQKVEVKVAGKVKRMPMYEALIRTMTVEALQGNAKARTELFKQVERLRVFEPENEKMGGLIFVPQDVEVYQWEIEMLIKNAVEQGHASIDGKVLKEIVDRHLAEDRRRGAAEEIKRLN
jgi:hypothetical protein